MQQERFGAFSWYKNQRGGIVLWVSLVIITLALIIGAVMWLLQSQGEHQKMSRRKADEISDYGMVIALDTINKNPAWAGPIPKTAFDGGFYEVLVKKTIPADSVVVTILVLGTFSSQTIKKRCVLARASVDSGGSWIRRALE